MDHLVENHSTVDPSFVEDFLLTYRTFFNEPTDICSQLLDWFDIPDLRDKVNDEISWIPRTHFARKSQFMLLSCLIFSAR